MKPLKKNKQKMLAILIKSSIVSLSLSSMAPSHAAISPLIQQRIDIGTARKFTERHPLVLDGLKRIETPTNDSITVVYEYETDSKEIKTCYARFHPTFLSIFLPKKAVRFYSSNCPIDY